MNLYSSHFFCQNVEDNCSEKPIAKKRVFFLSDSVSAKCYTYANKRTMLSPCVEAARIIDRLVVYTTNVSTIFTFQFLLIPKKHHQVRVEWRTMFIPRYFDNVPWLPTGVKLTFCKYIRMNVWSGSFMRMSSYYFFVRLGHRHRKTTCLYHLSSSQR